MNKPVNRVKDTITLDLSQHPRRKQIRVRTEAASKKSGHKGKLMPYIIDVLDQLACGTKVLVDPPKPVNEGE